MSGPFQLELLRLQTELRARLRDVGDARKALVFGLRATREAFGAEEAAVAVLKLGQASADLVFTMPQDASWDIELLTQYLAGTRPQIPSPTLLAPIERRGRKWAVLALRAAPFADQQRKALFWVTQILTDIIHALDRNRTGDAGATNREENRQSRRAQGPHVQHPARSALSHALRSFGIALHRQRWLRAAGTRS